MDLNSKLVEKIKSADNAITDVQSTSRQCTPLNTHCSAVESIEGPSFIIPLQLLGETINWTWILSTQDFNYMLKLIFRLEIR